MEYLNLCVNSIRKIEGLKRCESLQKLDLTLNFIDVEDLQESCEELEWCPDLRELHLTGNPCDKWEHYKDYVVGKVPQLKRLDGNLLERGYKLECKNKVAALEKELEKVAKENVLRKEFEKKEGKHNPDAWCPENRWRDYVEEQERQKKQEEEREANSMFKDFHEIQKENKVCYLSKLTYTIAKNTFKVQRRWQA